MSYKSINVSPKMTPQPSYVGSPSVTRPSPISVASTAILKTSGSGGLHPATAPRDIMRQEVSAVRINIVKDPKAMPIPTRVTESTPLTHLQIMTSETFPAAKVSRKVNSKAESKGIPMPEERTTAPGGIPQAFGAVFVESIDRSKVPRPANPTLPKIFPVLDQRDFKDVNGLLINRTANGKILGNAAQRFINPTHVPYNPPEEPVGPNNPYQQLNDTWTKCWDDEAGAVYYYNNQTGEATWLLPDELK